MPRLALEFHFGSDILDDISHQRRLSGPSFSGYPVDVISGSQPIQKARLPAERVILAVHLGISNVTITAAIVIAIPFYFAEPPRPFVLRLMLFEDPFIGMRECLYYIRLPLSPGWKVQAFDYVNGILLVGQLGQTR